MFPWFVFDLILSFIDRKTLKELRLVNCEFNQLALPKLLRIHALKNVKSPAYIFFLQKNGRLVRGLEIFDPKNFIKLCRSNLSFSDAFFRVRSIAIKVSGYTETEIFLRKFSSELLKLEHLKHISVEASYASNIFPKLNPLIQKLESFYYDSTNSIDFEEADFRGLKRLAFSRNTFIPFLEEHLRKSETIEEFVRCYDDGTNFSSIPTNSRWCERLSIHTNGFTFYELKLHKYSPRFNDILLKEPLDELGVFIREGKNHLAEIKDEEFPSLLDCIEHVTVDVGLEFKSDFSSCLPLKNIPSIEIVCFETEVVFPDQGSFTAFKLSCSIEDDYFPDFFSWANRCFPNLKHLYISNTVPLRLLPLEENSFPNLTHIYSEVIQHDAFWPELVKSAPKLNFIHYNLCKSDILKFESIKPFLQLKLHETILIGIGDVHEQTGFNKYL